MSLSTVEVQLLSATKHGRVHDVRRLLAAGAEVNKPSKCGYTPLHWASWYRYVDIVRLLLSSGANVHAATK